MFRLTFNTHDRPRAATNTDMYYSAVAYNPGKKLSGDVIVGISNLIEIDELNRRGEALALHKSKAAHDIATFVVSGALAESSDAFPMAQLGDVAHMVLSEEGIDIDVLKQELARNRAAQ